MTATAAKTETRTDRYGFPIKDCTRCGGSGRYSFNLMDGDRCYGCGGTGAQHTTKKVKDAFAAFVAAVRVAARPTLSACEVGDEITLDQNSSGRAVKGATWRTIARIEVTPAANGWSVAPDGTRTAEAYVAWVTWADGTTTRLSTNSLVVRRGRTVDPAPYVAQATTRAKRTR